MDEKYEIKERDLKISTSITWHKYSFQNKLLECIPSSPLNTWLIVCFTNWRIQWNERVTLKNFSGIAGSERETRSNALAWYISCVLCYFPFVHTYTVSAKQFAHGNFFLWVMYNNGMLLLPWSIPKIKRIRNIAIEKWDLKSFIDCTQSPSCL